MQYEQLIPAKRQLSVSAAAIIGEFYLVGVRRKNLDNRPHLSADKTLIRDIACQSNDIEKMNRLHRRIQFSLGHNTSRSATPVGRVAKSIPNGL